MKSHRYITFFILVLMSLGYFATDIYLPSFPALTAYFGVSDDDVQMTMFAYLISFSLTPLIFGPLSDHIGRKKVMLGGICICLIATLGCLFARSIVQLTIARFFQGFGAGAILISTRAMTSDLFTGKALAKQMSLLTMLMPLVLAIAPTLGGILQQYFNWQAVFLFLFIYMVAIFVMIINMNETLKEPSNTKITQIFSTYRQHLYNKRYLAFGVNFILPSFGLFAYWTVSPFLFQEVIGLSPIEYGFLALYIGATVIITGFINLKLIHYYATTTLISWGIGLIILSGCLLLLFHVMGILTTWTVLAPTLLFFTCMPLCVVNTASKAMSLVKRHFGAAVAILSTLQFLMGALGSFLFSLIPHETALSLGLCFLTIGLLSLANFRYALRLEMEAP